MNHTDPLMPQDKDLDGPLATPVQFDRWDQQGGESA